MFDFTLPNSIVNFPTSICTFATKVCCILNIKLNMSSQVFRSMAYLTDYNRLISRSIKYRDPYLLHPTPLAHEPNLHAAKCSNLALTSTLVYLLMHSRLHANSTSQIGNGDTTRETGVESSPIDRASCSLLEPQLRVCFCRVTYQAYGPCR